MVDIQLLKREMDEKNINISNLSELSGVDKSAISRLVSDESKTCTVETAQRISDALRLTSTKRGLIIFANEVAKKQLTKTTPKKGKGDGGTDELGNDGINLLYFDYSLRSYNDLPVSSLDKQDHIQGQ